MRTKTAVGTIVSGDRIPFARVLARSFHRYHPLLPFFTLIADGVQPDLDPGSEPFRVVHLDALAVPELRTLAFKYPKQQFSYCLTASFLRYLLDKGYSRAVFIKQESLVTGSLRGFFDRLSDSSVVLTPHLTGPLSGIDAVARELNILVSGTFNGGIVGVSDAGPGRSFLSWWHDRCSERCELAVAEGIHYEQRWLELAPSLFGGVSILRDPAYNVGHWNIPEREVRVGRLGRVRVGKNRGRLIRFSGYTPDRPEKPTMYSDRLSMGSIGDAARVFDRFGGRLCDEGFEQAKSLAYAFDRFDDGAPIPPIVRTIFTREGFDDGRFADPFAADAPDGYFAWLTRAESGRVSNLWRRVHGMRPDLVAAFPDPLGEDEEAFVEWIHRHGRHEHQVPDALLPGGRA